MRLALALLALLLTAAPAWATTTFDIGNETLCAAGVSCTPVGPVVPSNANEALVVFAVCVNNTASALPTSMTATWDTGGTNQAMTLFNTVNNATNAQVSIWYRLTPTAGAKTLLLQWTNSNTCYVGINAWSGVDQTTPLLNFNSATGNSATATTTKSPAVTAGNLAAAACGTNGGAVNTVTETQLWIDIGGCCGSGGMRCAQTGANCTTASTVFTCNLGATEWAIGAVEVQQVQAGGAAAPSRTLTGVGT